MGALEDEIEKRDLEQLVQVEYKVEVEVNGLETCLARLQIYPTREPLYHNVEAPLKVKFGCLRQCQPTDPIN